MKVVILPSAKRNLKNLPKDSVGLILVKLHSIRDNPLRYIERLKGSRLWKLRVGDYRAILIINTKDETINVLKVGHRKNIYKKR